MKNAHAPMAHTLHSLRRLKFNRFYRKLGFCLYKNNGA